MSLRGKCGDYVASQALCSYSLILLNKTEGLRKLVY